MTEGREIKFRSFDIRKKEMVYFGFREIADNYGPPFFIAIRRGDVAAMQFTGLRDKNGKEIYEGDIVEISAYNPSYRCKVVWGGKYNSCGFVLVGIKPWANGRVEFSNDDLNKNFENEFIEVIGNIYENPELLKEVSER